MKNLLTIFCLIISVASYGQRGHVIVGSARAADTNNVKAAVTVFDSTLRLVKYAADGTKAVFTSANGTLFLATVVTPDILDDTALAVRSAIPDTALLKFKRDSVNNNGYTTRYQNNLKLDAADTALLKFKRDSVNSNGYTTLYRNGLKLNASDTSNNVATKTFLLSNYHKQGGNSFGAENIYGSIDNNRLAWYTNNGRKMTLFANGNLLLGTGTTDAGYLLDVQGTSRFTGNTSYPMNAMIQWFDNTGGIGLNSGKLQGFNQGVRIYEGGTVVATFSSSAGSSTIFRNLILDGQQNTEPFVFVSNHVNTPSLRCGFKVNGWHMGEASGADRWVLEEQQAGTYTTRINVSRGGAVVVGSNPGNGASSSVFEVQSSTLLSIPAPVMTVAQRNAISSKIAGQSLYCSDCAADDASTGVMQTWNGSGWKNHW